MAIIGTCGFFFTREWAFFFMFSGRSRIVAHKFFFRKSSLVRKGGVVLIFFDTWQSRPPFI